MSATTTTTETRIDIECDQCGEGMNTANTHFGATMIVKWFELHKCPKKRPKRAES